MGRTYAGIDDEQARFIAAQKIFFVASAPLSSSGFVNLSPKGTDSFRVLDPHTVAFLDATGSGVETIAHLRENGRIAVMFCAFDGPPKILRLYGRGEAIERGDADFETLCALFPPRLAVRSVIRVRLLRISDSCGYGVPRFAYEGERSQMREWAERKGEEGARVYRATNNRVSIDGLPGLRTPER